MVRRPAAGLVLTINRLAGEFPGRGICAGSILELERLETEEVEVKEAEVEVMDEDVKEEEEMEFLDLRESVFCKGGGCVAGGGGGTERGEGIGRGAGLAGCP